MDWERNGVKIVPAGRWTPTRRKRRSMTRAAAITQARTGASKLWAGTVVVQPGAKTGPHHHGELETVLYIVRGRARMRWGDHLEFSGEAGPGDFIYVPPYVPHQEINARADQPCEAVVVRSGQDPIVVNLNLESPEPTGGGGAPTPFHPNSWGRLAASRSQTLPLRAKSMNTLISLAPLNSVMPIQVGRLNSRREFRHARKCDGFEMAAGVHKETNRVRICGKGLVTRGLRQGSRRHRRSPKASHSAPSQPHVSFRRRLPLRRFWAQQWPAWRPLLQDGCDQCIL